MKALIKVLKMREKAAYPSFMRQMQACRTWSDLQDYCESDQVKVHLLGDKGYLILTEDEVIDWVGDGVHSLKAFGLIKEAFGYNSIKVDLRQSTSWPIMKVMEQRGKIEITNTSTWEWGDEVMVEATINIVRRR